MTDAPEKLIAHVHLIARDSKDEQLYVFVEWGAKVQPAGSWILFSSLTPSTREWVCWDWEEKFPCLDFNRFAPVLRCTSSLVTLVVDDSSDASSSSSSSS